MDPTVNELTVSFRRGTPAPGPSLRTGCWERRGYSLSEYLEPAIETRTWTLVSREKPSDKEMLVATALAQGGVP